MVVVGKLKFRDKNGEVLREGDTVLYNRNINDALDKEKFIITWCDDRYCLENEKLGLIEDVSWELTEKLGGDDSE